MNRIKNLYIITGKGGVGKTTQALALCKYLQDTEKRKVHYAYFKSNSIKDGQKDIDQGHLMAQSLGLNYMGLELAENARSYIAKKLKSTIVASWIVKTPFFKALINMIPSFSYLIYLGKILELIHDSKEETTVVLDSPSSGHALTMLESTKNFQDIFGSGVVFDDTKRMLSLLTSSGFAKINIICLPTEMAIHEALDLKAEISSTLDIEKSIFCNNVLEFTPEEQKKLPDFLFAKVQNEKIVLEKYENDIAKLFPHCPSLDQKEIIESIVPRIKNLV